MTSLTAMPNPTSPAALIEEELVASRRVKWSVAGVTHRGWVCVDKGDLGDPQIVCQMCDSQTIRYVQLGTYARAVSSASASSRGMIWPNTYGRCFGLVRRYLFGYTAPNDQL